LFATRSSRRLLNSYSMEACGVNDFPSSATT
jgi:hypothetical protein